ncbi:MAG: N-acetyltransferase [Gammaproteobacteria bacterium]|nr:N-acetyltransferase [Gammaproteobacteria bacterium]
MTNPQQIIRGADIAKHIEALGQFRIDIFREYPYLYAGDMKYERDYLTRYAQCEHSILLLESDEHGIKAACTAMPLSAETEEFRAPFSPAEQLLYFYIGELMVRSDARGQRLGSQLLAQMIQLIEASDYQHLCLYTVERAPDHPARPDNYHAPDTLWQKFGFRRNGKQVSFAWKDIGDVASSHKPMNVWTRTP